MSRNPSGRVPHTFRGYLVYRADPHLSDEEAFLGLVETYEEFSALLARLVLHVKEVWVNDREIDDLWADRWLKDYGEFLKRA